MGLSNKMLLGGAAGVAALAFIGAGADGQDGGGAVAGNATSPE